MVNERRRGGFVRLLPVFGPDRRRGSGGRSCRSRDAGTAQRRRQVGRRMDRRRRRPGPRRHLRAESTRRRQQHLADGRTRLQPSDDREPRLAG